MIQSSNFDSGRGLFLHIRTTLAIDRGEYYSYISHAALRIGKDVVEITKRNHFYVNGDANPNLPLKLEGEHFFYRHTQEVGTPLERLVYHVELGHGGYVKFVVYKKYITIRITAFQEDLYDAAGLLGSYPEGALLARNGLTLVQEFTDFGQEWQVRPLTDSLLFQETRAPQFPEECRLPPLAVGQRHRRLKETDLVEEQKLRKEANEACVHREDFEDCVFDVMATGDLGLAVAGEI